MMPRGKTIFKVITIITMVVTLIIALYIMANGLGLAPDLDFGAGAYYYADIPNFDELIDMDQYQARMPYWVYVILFLAWGCLMYLLWKWVDRRGKKS